MMAVVRMSVPEFGLCQSRGLRGSIAQRAIGRRRAGLQAFPAIGVSGCRREIALVVLVASLVRVWSRKHDARTTARMNMKRLGHMRGESFIQTRARKLSRKSSRKSSQESSSTRVLFARPFRHTPSNARHLRTPHIAASIRTNGLVESALNSATTRSSHKSPVTPEHPSRKHSAHTATV